MAALLSEDSWAWFQRCLERVREGADAPLVPVIGSGLHLWAGLPKQSPVTDWYELLWQVRQYLKLDDFPLEALKDFWSCKFSRDGQGWQRGARVSTSSDPLILLSDVRFTCTPHSSDHGKIYTRGFFDAGLGFDDDSRRSE